MNIKYRPRFLFCPKAAGFRLAAFAALVVFDQGQIDESLFETYCKDVAAALMRWPAAAPRFDILLDRYPETKEYQIFAAVIHRGRHLI